MTPIINLKGKPEGDYILFGLICEIQEKLYLQDVDSLIEIQFTVDVCLLVIKMKIGHGLFTTNTFALVAGSLSSEV